MSLSIAVPGSHWPDPDASTRKIAATDRTNGAYGFTGLALFCCAVTAELYTQTVLTQRRARCRCKLEHLGRPFFKLLKSRSDVMNPHVACHRASHRGTKRASLRHSCKPHEDVLGLPDRQARK